MDIQTQQALGIFTDSVVSAFKKKATTTNFLGTFFPEKYSPTKLISVAVTRDKEKIAVDVERGSQGNRNTFSSASIRNYKPPFFDEFFDATELDLYDRLFGDKSINEDTFSAFVLDVADKMDILRFKVERKYEYMRAQVFEDGVVTVKNGDNINFNRKAESMVANVAGNTWTTDTVDPYQTIAVGCEFIRKEALYMGGHHNVILGSEAHAAFFNNAIVKGRNNLQQLKLDDLNPPRPIGAGAVYHGRVTAGQYTADLWTYPQFYEDAAGAKQPYINPKKIIVLPAATNFEMCYAAVPQLLTGGGMMLQQGPWLPYDYVDVRKCTHDFGIKSAGVPVPVAIDEMHTTQVIPDAGS